MIKWLTLTAAVVILQVYFLAGLTDLYPYLTLLVVLIAAARLPWQRSLVVALLVGFLLDSFSMHTFGLFSLIYFGAWIVAKWLQRSGLVIKGAVGMSAAILLLVFWQALMLLGLAAFRSGVVEIISLLPLFIGQFVVTLFFALPSRRLL